MNRPKRGYLLLKEKKHFVYEGLNLIGRQKGATFVIPDINISHQHSVIVIVDNHHYLSDANSSNGTYLKELKLHPMQLYELNNGDVIKFGLIKVEYFKIEGDIDITLENVGIPLTQIDENIFDINTQLHDFSILNDIQNINHRSLEHNKAQEKQEDVGTVSINDLPTQLFVDPNDSCVGNEVSFSDGEEKMETSISDIPINDLPTQIVIPNIDVDFEENEVDVEKERSISDIPINDLPTQIVINEKDGDSSYISDTDNLNTDHHVTTSNLIEDTIINDNNNDNNDSVAADVENHGENSRESVNLPTMQPLSAQYSSSESQSQLYVKELQRRVRNTIASSDDECSETGSRLGKGDVLADEEHHDETSKDSTDLLTMQPVSTQHFSSEFQSQLYVKELQRRVRNIIESSDDESSEIDSRLKKDNVVADEEHHDENTKDSTDLLTMQPVSTQNFAPEPQSQLFVKELQRRLRNVITSSDDEKDSRKSHSPLSMAHDQTSDDETDVEAHTSLLSEKKKSLTKKNKPVIDTDSDEEGSSTDAEEELKNLSASLAPMCLDKKSGDADKKKKEGEEIKLTDIKHVELRLDDSDIIPTTQNPPTSKKYSSINETESQRDDVVAKLKNASQATNMEASLPFDSSFDLVLTNSPSPTSPDDIENGDTAKPDIENEEKVSAATVQENTQNEPESQQTQFEVSFDEDNLESRKVSDIERPPNPMVNLFEAATPSTSSMERNETIEEKLSKMFASQSVLAERDEDVFVIPTQKIVLKKTAHSKEIVKHSEEKRGEIVTKIGEHSAKENVEDSERNRNDILIEDDDNLFLQPTQLVVNNPEISPPLRDEDIFAIPTQKVVLEKASHSKENVKNSGEKLGKTPTKMGNNSGEKTVQDPGMNRSEILIDDDDNLFLQPTQLVVNNPEISPALRDEDIFAIPTQKVVLEQATHSKENVKNSEEELGKLPTKMGSNSGEKNVEDSERNRNEILIEEDDLFLQPTQVISNEKTSKEISEKSAVISDIFLQPTQMITDTEEEISSVVTPKSHSIKVISDKILFGAIASEKTKKISKDLIDDADHDIFLQPTQVVTNIDTKEEEIAADSINNKKKDSEITEKCTSSKKLSRYVIVESDEEEGDVNEDIFQQPTQMIKTLNVVTNEKSVNIAVGKKIPENQTETDVFLQPTQIIDDSAVPPAKKSDENDIFSEPTQILTFSKNNSSDKSDTYSSKSVISSQPKGNTENKDKSIGSKEDTKTKTASLKETLLIQPREIESCPNLGKEGIENKIIDLAVATEDFTKLETTSSNQSDALATPTVKQSGTKLIDVSQKDEEKKIECGDIENSDDPMRLNDNLELDEIVAPNKDMQSTPIKRRKSKATESENTAKRRKTRNTRNMGEESERNESDKSTRLRNKKKESSERELTLNEANVTAENTEISRLSSKGASRDAESLYVVKEILGSSEKISDTNSEDEFEVKKEQEISPKTFKRTKRSAALAKKQTKPEQINLKTRQKKTDAVAKEMETTASTSSIITTTSDSDNATIPTKHRKIEKKTSEVSLQPIQPKSTRTTRTARKDMERGSSPSVKEIPENENVIGVTNEMKDTASISSSIVASTSDSDNVAIPAKHRKIEEKKSEASLQSIQPKSSRTTRTARKEIVRQSSPGVQEIPESENMNLDNERVIGTRKTGRSKAKPNVAEQTRNEEELSSNPVDVNLDSKNETSTGIRKGGRTRTKQKEIQDIDDQKELCSSSSNNTDAATSSSGSNKVRKSRIMKVKESEQLHGNESESSGNTTADVKKVRSRRGRANSVTSEEDFQKVKSETKISPPVVSTPATPERTKRKLKPKIVFTMLDSPELETIIRSLGGFVVDSVNTSTVILTTSVKRSLKLLTAIGQSKPICSPKWLHESKKANAFLDPWDYILEDHEAEEKWNFSLKESLRRGGERKLLEKYTFQLMVNNALDVLKGSIESCGGKCVSRAPSKDSRANFVIVASPENKNKYARFLKEKPPPKIVAVEAIFDGILRQELHFEEHLLT